MPIPRRTREIVIGGHGLRSFSLASQTTIISRSRMMSKEECPGEIRRAAHANRAVRGTVALRPFPPSLTVCARLMSAVYRTTKNLPKVTHHASR
jgi:hypothetical protein